MSRAYAVWWIITRPLLAVVAVAVVVTAPFWWTL